MGLQTCYNMRRSQDSHYLCDLLSLLLLSRVVCVCLQKGKEGVREQYEQTDDFHEKWKIKARDMLAKSEWRRRKLVKRVSTAQPGGHSSLATGGTPRVL